MNLKTIVKKLGFRLLPVVVLLGFVLMPFSSQSVVQALPSAGIVCTENASSTFTLTTKTGYISIPDGNVVFMWGYSEGNKPFQHPGPVLCVREGDTVTIVLKNTLAEPVSIMFPGQENVKANGVPVSPEYDLAGTTLLSLTKMVQPGASLSYQFVATKPGTFTYLSGTNPTKQVQMGLFGALIVRPAAHADWAYNKADTQFKPSTEFMTLLSEIDPVMHQAVERNVAFDIRNYKPRYFLINGRAFPDTIAPNYATWLPNQPYGSIARIQPIDAANTQPALVRLLNFAASEIPFHPHGNSGRIIGRDGNVLAGPGGQDLSYDKYTVNLGSGQTWDSLFTWENVDAYDPVLNPVPVTVPNEQNSTFGELFSGSPYLGNNQPLPPGTLTFNQCGEYYHIAHNHSLQQITSWGITMSGQLTVTRIDPPSPNLCP